MIVRAFRTVELVYHFVSRPRKLARRNRLTIVCAAVLFSFGWSNAFAGPIENVIEIDGDCQDAPGGGLDWSCLVSGDCDPGNTAGIGLRAFARVFDLCPDSPDPTADINVGCDLQKERMTTFSQNTKDITEVGIEANGDWRYAETGSAPDKANIVNALAALIEDPVSGDQILAFAGDRYAVDGDGQIGAWFFQNEISLNADGTFSGVHVPGDILVLANFTAGGTVSNLELCHWVREGVVDCKSVLAVPTVAHGSSNVGGSPCWTYRDKDGDTSIYQTNAFFSAAINLSEAERQGFIDDGDLCFLSFIIETRSSPSITARLHDFALGTFKTCADICGVKQEAREPACGEAAVCSDILGTLPGWEISLYEDKNDDSIPDPAELITINGSGNALINPQMTDADGAYTFVDLPNGLHKYIVCERIPETANGDRFTWVPCSPGDGTLYTDPPYGDLFCYDSFALPADQCGELGRDFTNVRNPVCAILEVTKSCSSTASAGSTTSYEITVTNSGDGDAIGAVVVDDYDESYLTIDPASVSDGGTDSSPAGLLTWTIDVPAGQSRRLSYSGTFADTLPTSPVTVANTVTVTGSDNDAPVTTSCSTSVTGPPDLIVTTDCTSEVVAGSRMTYTVQVANQGASPAVDVVVTNILPDELSFVSATPSPSSVDGNTLTFSLGDVTPGQSLGMTIQADVIAAAGTSVNQVSATSATTETELASVNNGTACTFTILAPDLSLEKSCPPEMIAGEQVSYTLSVHNSGTAAAKNVLVVDVLPSEVTFVSAVPAPTSRDGDTLTFALGEIAPDATATVTINATVQANNGTSSNVATVESSTPESGDGTTNNADTCNSTVIAPDLAVSKTCPSQLVSGEEATYTINVSNDGSAAAKSVVVTDVLPSALSFVAAEPAPTSTGGGSLVFNLGDLDPQASVAITVTVMPLATSGKATNSVTATTTSSEGGAVEANNADQCSSDVVAADISLTKSCPAAMIAGNQHRYTILVANNGGATAREVVLTDALPDEVSYVSATPTPTSVEGNTLTFELGDIPAGASLAATVDVMVTATSGTSTNHASVTTTSTEGGQAASDNDTSCTSNVVAPDIAVTKSCPESAVAGEVLAYSVTLTNAGTAAAENVVLTDTLPADVAFVDAQVADGTVVHDGSETGGVVTAYLGDVATNATAILEIRVRALTVDGQLANTVTASTDSTEGGQADANNTSACQSNVTAPDVVVAKSCPSSLVAGTSATYTVLVSNAGTATAKNVVITDPLPSELAFDSATVTSGTVSHDGAETGGVVTATVGDIPAGGSASLTIQVRVISTSGSAVNEASATTDSLEGGAGTGNNSDQCDSGQVLAPDLALRKSCPVHMIAGETASYTLTVTNSGTAAAHDVVLTDTLPAEVTFVSSIPEADSVEGDSPSFVLGDVAAGESRVVTLEVTVGATQGSPTNSASVTTTSVEGGAGADNNDASCSSDIIVADVTIAKTCPSPVKVNSSASFVVEFSNTGTADAKDVVVTDVLPAGFFQDGTITVSSTVGSAAVDGLNVSADVGTLAPGAGGTLTVSGVVSNSSSAGGGYDNQAAIVTSRVQSDESNDSAGCSSQVTAPALSLSKSAEVTLRTVDLSNAAELTSSDIIEKADATADNAGINAGATIVYTISYQNTGDADAAGAVLKDTLPSGVTLVSVSNGGVVNGNVVTWPLGTIPAGGSGSVTVTVKVGQ